MSGEQKKLSAAPTRNNTSFARNLEEHTDPPSGVDPPRDNRPNDVDSIVSSFLLELDLLSRQCDPATAPRSRPEASDVTVSTPQPEVKPPPEVLRPSEVILPAASEAAQSSLETELAATLEELEREQSNVVPLPSRERVPVESRGRNFAGAPKPEDIAVIEHRAEETSNAAPALPHIQSAVEEEVGAIPLPAQDGAGSAFPVEVQAAGEVGPGPAPDQSPSSVEAGPAGILPYAGEEQVVPAAPEIPSGAGIEESAQVATETVLGAEQQPKTAEPSENSQGEPAAIVTPEKRPDTVLQKAQPEPDYILRGIYEEHRHRKRMLVTQLIVIVVILLAGLTIGYLYVKSKTNRPRGTPTQSSVAPSSAQTTQPEENVSPSSLPGENAASGTGNPDTSTLVGFSTPGRADTKVIAAEPVKKVLPPYPTAAKGQKIFTKVELDVDVQIDEKGNVVRATAVNGPALFRSDAEKALMKWLFNPASRDGVPVPSTVRITVVFNPQ